MWVWGHYFMQKVCIQGLAGSWLLPEPCIQEQQRSFQGEGSNTKHVKPCPSPRYTSPCTAPAMAWPQDGFALGGWVHLDQAAFSVHTRPRGRSCLSTSGGDTECPELCSELGVRAEAALAWGTHVSASKTPWRKPQKYSPKQQQLGCLNAERENYNHIKGPEDINIYSNSCHSCFSSCDELTVFIFLCKARVMQCGH